VPTEWAKRVTGPVEPDRVKGICSGCGTRISVTTKRPLRIACPVCGRTRLLT
jgi:DNA-directed RNA polymerase subunit RPC12/RpoP